jgi:hypothetical protein
VSEPRTFFEELGAALHWSTSGVIVVLWAYVDDSNIHDRITGKATTIGHGGGIASFERWQSLERQWKAAVDDEAAHPFHMTDFETNNQQFRGWSIERHKAFLDRLLEIIDQHVECFVGYSVPATPRKAFADTHKASIGRMLYYCGEMAKAHGKGGIHLVFAHHPEVKTGGLAAFLDTAWRAFPEIASFTGAKPADCYALQAADLLAYEFVRWRNAPNATAARYPIRKLMSGSLRPCRVFHALARLPS